MPRLQGFPTAQQATENSCWAAAAREISNWYQSRGESGENPVYDSDQAFADAWAEQSGNEENANINIQQSAAAALEDLGYDNNTDDAAIPSQQEITDTINNNRPLLAIVAGEAPDPNPNPEVQEGHWVVIIGISQDQANIDVFDPDDGQVHTVAYNAATYQPDSYWQNTSYVDPIAAQQD